MAIARALAEDPEAILYDEPTTMVDPLMAAHMSDSDRAIEENVTQDLDRGDARYAPCEKTCRSRDFSAGGTRGIFWNVARSWWIRRIRFSAIFCRKMN